MLADNLNLDAQKVSGLLNTGGLNATETGGTDDAVLRWNAAAAVTGLGITEATTAANGTIITIDRPGEYDINLTGLTEASGTVDVGVSANVAAAGLNSNPEFAILGFLKVIQPILTPAALQIPFTMNTKVFVIKGTAQLVRFHATNGSDAAPDFSSTIAEFSYRITRVQDVRGRS